MSVVLYVHNGGDHLEGALESILNQTHDALELCVVDDGSTDGTEQLLRQAAVRDSRVRVERQAHLGSDRLHETVNHAIAMSRHDLIATANADDLWLPRKLETQVAAFAADPALDICWHEATFIDVDGKVTRGGFRPIPSPLPAGPPRPWHFVSGNPIPNPTTMFRRSILRQIGLQEVGQAHDHQFWMKATIAGCRFAGLPDRLIRYRVHEASESTASTKRVQTLAKHTESVAMMIDRHGIEGLFPELTLVDHDPDSVAWAWSYLGSLLWERSRHELAEAAWTESVRVASNPGPLCNLAIAAATRGDRHRAITLFSSAAEAGVGRARAALASPHTAADIQPLPWRGAEPPVVELVDQVTAGDVDLPHPSAVGAADAVLVVGSTPDIMAVPGNRDAIVAVLVDHAHRTGGVPSRLIILTTSEELLTIVVDAYSALERGAPHLLAGLDIDVVPANEGTVRSVLEAHLLDGAALVGPRPRRATEGVSPDPQAGNEPVSEAPELLGSAPATPVVAPATLAG